VRVSDEMESCSLVKGKKEPLKKLWSAHEASQWQTENAQVGDA
jgi:hypothetical protein